MKLFCSAFIALFLFGAQSTFAASSEAKKLGGRLGLGFTNQIATTALGNIPALSAKYYLNDGFAVSIGTGFDTRDVNSTLAMGLKLFKNAFIEPNLLFYLGGGFAYVNQNGSKAQGSVFFGSEFFLSQLPSLGLSFEAGIRGDSNTGSFSIRTTGDSFLTAGMHFYL